MASGDTLFILTPQSYTPPAANYATLDTIADGMRSPALGDIPFPIVAELCQSRALPVNDDEVRHTRKNE